MEKKKRDESCVEMEKEVMRKVELGVRHEHHDVLHTAVVNYDPVVLSRKTHNLFFAVKRVAEETLGPE